MTPTRSALLVSLIACLFVPPAALAQGPMPNRPGRAWRISIEGDLDAMVLVDQFEALLIDAHERRASLVMLEMSGNAWRTDVVWAMAQVVQQVDVPVIAFLQDTSDHRVGAGQLMLASLCEQSWIDPETTITCTQDDDRASLAPDSTDWERVHRELAGSIWLRLHERDGPVQIARPLVDQQDSVWIDSEKESLDDFGQSSDTNSPGLKRGNEPPVDAKFIMTVEEDKSFQIAMSPELVAELKLITAIESRPAVVLREAGSNPVSPRKLELKSGLAAVHADAWTMLEQLDALLVSLERLPTTAQSAGQRSWREIRMQLLSGLADYQRGQKIVDRSISKHPEVLKMPPPKNHPRDFEATRKALDARYEKLKAR